MFSEADRLAYLNYSVTLANLAINSEILQINKLIYESDEKRNQEITELLKEIRDENKRRDTWKSIWNNRNIGR